MGRFSEPVAASRKWQAQHDNVRYLTHTMLPLHWSSFGFHASSFDLSLIFIWSSSDLHLTFIRSSCIGNPKFISFALSSNPSSYPLDNTLESLNLIFTDLHLKASTGVWWYAIVFDGILRCSTASDNIRRYLQVSENIWRSSKVLENMRKCLKILKGIWSY